jgi:hypothetical protein
MCGWALSPAFRNRYPDDGQGAQTFTSRPVRSQWLSTSVRAHIAKSGNAQMGPSTISCTCRLGRRALVQIERDRDGAAIMT